MVNNRLPRGNAIIVNVRSLVKKRVGQQHSCVSLGVAQISDTLTINENGERFTNEDAEFEQLNNELRYQPKPGWYSQIFDANYVDQVTEWGGKATAPEKLEIYMPDIEMDRSVESGAGVLEYLIDTHRCDTLEELAEALGIPPMP